MAMPSQRSIDLCGLWFIPTPEPPEPPPESSSFQIVHRRTQVAPVICTSRRIRARRRPLFDPLCHSMLALFSSHILICGRRWYHFYSKFTFGAFAIIFIPVICCLHILLRKNKMLRLIRKSTKMWKASWNIYTHWSGKTYAGENITIHFIFVLRFSQLTKIQLGNLESNFATY